MFLCDTGSLAFMAVNESAIACYGYDKNSFLALTLLDIVPPETGIRSRLRSETNRIWAGDRATFGVMSGPQIDVVPYWRATVFRARPA